MRVTNKPGRPSGRNYPVTLHVGLTVDQRAAVEAAAKRNGQTLTEYVRAWIDSPAVQEGSR